MATTEDLVRLEYAEVVDATSLEPVEVLAQPEVPGVRGGPEGAEVLVAVAARVGDVRLIDNMTLRVAAAGVGVDLGVTVAPTTPGEATCAAG